MAKLKHFQKTFDTFRREENPPAIRAEFYEGDTTTNGMKVHYAKSAVLGINNVTHSKGIIAGAIDDIPDAGIGGRSDAKYNVGVYGYSENGTGVLCKSMNYEALHAETNSTETAAVAAYNRNPDSNSAALFAKKNGTKGYAAVFEGDVIITAGNLNVKSGLLQINGESIWEIITTLQGRVKELEALVIATTRRAEAAAYEASRANSRIDAIPTA